MLPTLLILIAFMVGIGLWLMSVQRRMVILDENTNHAMGQIGVQLSGCFDALMALLDLIKCYAADEAETLIETIQSRRSIITAKSTPDDVIKQEGVILVALRRISMITEQYPELKANENCMKILCAVQIYDNMVQTSCLIYNDCVAKLNRYIRLFPVSMVAGILGFSQRDYWEDICSRY